MPDLEQRGETAATFSTDIDDLHKLQIEMATLKATTVTRQELAEEKLRQSEDLAKRGQANRMTMTTVIAMVAAILTVIAGPLAGALWLINVQIRDAISPIVARLTSLEIAQTADRTRGEQDKSDRTAARAEIIAGITENAAALRNATSVIGQQVRELESQNRGIADGNTGECIYVNSMLEMLARKVPTLGEIPRHECPKYTVIHPAEPNASTAR